MEKEKKKRKIILPDSHSSYLISVESHTSDTEAFFLFQNLLKWPLKNNSRYAAHLLMEKQAT